jgi:hypothetical protein
MSSNRAIPVKLFIGILKVKNVHLTEPLEERLTSDFGPSDHRMILVPSDGTIHRVFLSFDRLIETESLPKIRDLTPSIEKEFSAELIVGYVDNRRIVVGEAAGTGGSENGIPFKDGGIQFPSEPLPDYLSGTSQEFFLSMRKTYRAQMRSICLLRK